MVLEITFFFFSYSEDSFIFKQVFVYLESFLLTLKTFIIFD